jgi:hypothetical protein
MATTGVFKDAGGNSTDRHEAGHRCLYAIVLGTSLLVGGVSWGYLER